MTDEAPDSLLAALSTRSDMTSQDAAERILALTARLAAVEAERDQLQTKLIETLNDVSRLLDQERRRWYTALALLGDLEGLAPEVVGDQVKALVQGASSREARTP